jgi:hypothetical protein
MSPLRNSPARDPAPLLAARFAARKELGIRIQEFCWGGFGALVRSKSAQKGIIAVRAAPGASRAVHHRA